MNPPVTQSPVCVTGASGFIGAHVVQKLLKGGYQVHGTVRKDPAHYDFLMALEGAERLRLFQAELLDEGSYDDAVAGCAYVIHTASPYVVDAVDPQRDLVDPAVKGTLTVLAAAKKAGVKRVVLTSSMAAISDEPLDDHTFTEADWNDKSTLDRNPYYFSKVEAERAAWRFVEDGAAGFDLVVINPFMVIGPSLGPGLNTSNQMFRDMMTGVYPAVMNLAWGFVDVRDVAEAHVCAMENSNAHGRYLCANETLTMKQVVALLREGGYADRTLPVLDMTCSIGDFAVRLLSYTQPRGTGSYMRTHIGKVMKFDNSKILRELGMAFRPVRESILDACADMEKWGHLSPSKAPLRGGRGATLAALQDDQITSGDQKPPSQASAQGVSDT